MESSKHQISLERFSVNCVFHYWCEFTQQCEHRPPFTRDFHFASLLVWIALWMWNFHPQWCEFTSINLVNFTPSWTALKVFAVWILHCGNKCDTPRSQKIAASFRNSNSPLPLFELCWTTLVCVSSCYPCIHTHQVETLAAMHWTITVTSSWIVPVIRMGQLQSSVNPRWLPPWRHPIKTQQRPSEQWCALDIASQFPNSAHYPKNIVLQLHRVTTLGVIRNRNWATVLCPLGVLAVRRLEKWMCSRTWSI